MCIDWGNMRIPKTGGGGGGGMYRRVGEGKAVGGRLIGSHLSGC